MSRSRYAVSAAGLVAALLTINQFDVPAAGGGPVVDAPLGSLFTPVTPVRVLDTRSGGGALGTGEVRALDLSTRAPVEATAVVLNVTAVAPSLASFVTVYPTGADRPTASNLNLVAGRTRPNAVVTLLGTGRSVNLYNDAGSVHLVVDLAGYYRPVTGSGFTPLSPVRVLDTRTAGGPLGPGAVRTVDLSGRLPSAATAVTFNLTGLGATASTFVTAWPDATTRPNVSNLNPVPGETAPNQVTVTIGANRRVNLFNNAGSTHLVVDLAGYHVAGGGLLFFPRIPLRVLDTRPDLGLNAGATGDLDLVTWVPSRAGAAVFNLTGTDPTAATFVTAWPYLADRPVASNLNLVAGQTAPNLTTVALADAKLSLYNHVGYVNLVVDLAGYFGTSSPCAGAGAEAGAGAAGAGVGACGGG